MTTDREALDAIQLLIEDVENKYGDPHTLRHAKAALAALTAQGRYQPRDRKALVKRAYEAARESLSEYRQQDDYLLAHGASLLSEESHEIFHIDSLRRVVKAAVEVALSAQGGEQSDTVSEVDGWRNLADELLGSLVYIRTHFGSRNPYRKNSEAYINWLSAEQEQFDIADAVIERAKGLLAAAKEGK